MAISPQQLIQIHREKLQDLLRRSSEALEQISDQDANWRPNPESNSIANLVVHMHGNLQQRLAAGIAGQPDTRDRDAEFFSGIRLTREELQATLKAAFEQADVILARLAPEDLEKLQRIRNRQVTVLDVLFTVVTHMSEHVGQILYIAKQRLGSDYRVLSIPPSRRADAAPEGRPIRSDPLRRVDVAYVLIANTEKQILMVENEDGSWSLPGGKREDGETLAEAAEREAREETGLQVRLGPVLHVSERLWQDHDLFVTFGATVVDGALGEGLLTDVRRVAWKPLREAQALMPYHKDLAALLTAAAGYDSRRAR